MGYIINKFLKLLSRNDSLRQAIGAAVVFSGLINPWSQFGGNNIHAETDQSNKAALMPDVVVLPWHFLRILPELRVASKPRLKAIQKEVTRRVSQQSLTLRQFLEANDAARRLSWNALRQAEKILVGTAKQAGMRNRLLVSPVMCSVGQKYLFFLTGRFELEHTLAWAEHVAIDRFLWDKALKEEGVDTLLSLRTQNLWQRFSSGLKGSSAKPEGGSALQLGLSLTHNRTRLDRGSAHCLNLLLAEQLTRDGFSVTMPVADELMQTLQFVIPTQSKRRRPTRRAVLSGKIRILPLPR